MLDDELRDVLRDLINGTRASAAAIVHAASADEVPRAPLGKGAQLELRGAPDDEPDAIAAALERAARAVRAAARRWGVNVLPELTVAAQRAPGLERNRVLDRIVDYLRAFSNAQGVRNAAVISAGQLIASASALDERDRSRVPFLLRQVRAEAERRKGETAHVEILADDACAFAFWVDACLIAFTHGDYAPDFVRHRARLVTREIGQLLPHLDDPPEAPARLAPIPE